MSPKRRFTILLALTVVLTAVLLAGCSGGSGQGDTLKPPPNIRVAELPSATATLEVPAMEIPATPSLVPTAAVVYYDPTPDSDALANQIDSAINDIEQKLRSQNLLLKP
jgi:predicted small secreted protein